MTILVFGQDLPANVTFLAIVPGASRIASSEVAWGAGRVLDAVKTEWLRPKGGLQISLESRPDNDAKWAKFSGSTSEENGDVCAILAGFEIFNKRRCEGGSCSENGGEEAFREHRERSQ